MAKPQRKKKPRSELSRLRGANARLEKEVLKLRDELAKVRSESLTDPLTDLPNRRAFEEHFRREMMRAHRAQKPLVLCLADLDGLKFVNDTYGHQEGDKLLKRFAQLLCAGLRATDFCGRLAGDEFALLLPETSEQQAKLLIERLQREIFDKGLVMTFGGGETLRVRASFGVAEMIAAEGKAPHEAEEQFFKRADDRLYASKVARKLSTR